MYTWEIAPGAYNHLVDVLTDALNLGEAAKIERTPQGGTFVTAPNEIASAWGSTHRHDGVELNFMQIYTPGHDSPDKLGNIIETALNWRSHIVITADTDEEGITQWVVQHPEPHPEA
ncbi:MULTISPECIES: hypothetical protein [Actinomyces]|uniref:Uncharacterized protein n=1 Tax=Actinomyces succiniciruminis TaxID=1522002 RepID=A0A1L7RLD0_9ACTO|nr:MULTISPECIES: hypothetical protein [Actinomyces]CED91949.1 Hypothetical protein AAM4_2117 [Actinomyces succiniciruminis]